MEKFLLANIGNRNIEIEGLRFNNDTFRDQTKQILDNYDTYENKISLHIITPVIDEVKDSLSHIILFYTDSPEGTRNNQDTLYAAEIIRRKLSQLYPTIHVHTEPLKCKVTDVNELMLRYRRIIKNLQNQYPQHAFVLCEAGGTSQLKFALKIICEFAIDENRLECFNVDLENQDARSSNVVKYHAVEYKKIILAEQVTRLLDSLNYDSIILLAGSNSEGILNKKSKFLIDIGVLAVNMNIDRLTKIFNNQCSKEILSTEPIKELVEKSWYNYPDWIKEYIDYDDYLHICLATDAAHCFSETGKYGLAVLYYHIAIENIMDAFLKSVVKVDIHNKEKWEKLKTDIATGLFQFKSRFEKISYDINTASVPFKIEFIRSNIQSDELYKLLDAYESVNGFYLMINNKKGIAIDTLRNKFAHEGRIVSDTDFKTIEPFISALKEFIGISDKNLFTTLNNQIRKSLL